MNALRRVGIEERNLVQLNPILGLNRVSAGFHSWERKLYLEPFGLVDLKCQVAPGFVVPHGLDADILFALVCAYEDQGRPADRMVYLRVGEICEYACLTRTSNTYVRIEEGLQRLLWALLSVRSSWTLLNGDEVKRESVSFRILHTIAVSDQGKAGKPVSARFNPATRLGIRLSEEILASVDSGFTRQMDLQLYSQLQQPFARLLCRQLEEQRHISKQSTYTVPLIGWGEHLGLLEPLRELEESKPVRNVKNPFSAPVMPTRVITPDRLRRALNAAHEELKDHHYLESFEYIGRGRNQQVHYTFADTRIQSSTEHISQIVYPKAQMLKAHSNILNNVTEGDLLAQRLLVDRGIHPNKAAQYSKAFSSDQIIHAVKMFDLKIASGKTFTNPRGLLIDILKNPESYEDIEQALSRQLPRKVPTSKQIPVIEQALEVIAPPTERSPKSAEIALGRMFDATQDQALKERLVAAYVQGHLNTLQLAELTRLDLANARTQGLVLLGD